MFKTLLSYLSTLSTSTQSSVLPPSLLFPQPPFCQYLSSSSHPIFHPLNPSLHLYSSQKHPQRTPLRPVSKDCLPCLRAASPPRKKASKWTQNLLNRSQTQSSPCSFQPTRPLSTQQVYDPKPI
ncbi:hypothetical protein F4805DRAFT_429990 [Annulohypoxylon moriforme]|nr:hypothetical protein F4805DRAFT_429990 [Annulohypoxylon moriforme]